METLLPDVLLALNRRKCILATAQLNQWALDFDGNLKRIMESIQQAKAGGATYRLGPELELCGYGCEDHFLESDTFLHCEQSLAAILSSGITNDILCDIGCPIIHNGVRYNCRVYCLNGRIVLIRPKLVMANDGNYREHRYFTPWQHRKCIQEHLISQSLISAIQIGTKKYQDSLRSGDSNSSGNFSKPVIVVAKSVPFGDAIVQTADTFIASEICEELWSPLSSHTELCLSGVEIITNGSGSHHSLYKLDSRYELIQSAMRKCGGVYMYANQRGCDAGRLYYDGSSLVCCNGELCGTITGSSGVRTGADCGCVGSAQGSQFSLRDVEVVISCVDLDDVTRYRQAMHSFQEQAANAATTSAAGGVGGDAYPVIDLTHFRLCTEAADRTVLMPAVSAQTEVVCDVNVKFVTSQPEEECLFGPACWLWDYLRRSGANGFMLPLSGGADSAAVATIVYTMCAMAVKECAAGNAQVRRDTERLLGRTLSEQDVAKLTAKTLCNSVLHTVYIGTDNSSRLTASRAERLASDISSYHTQCNINTIVDAIIGVFNSVFPLHKPAYKVHGGSHTQDLALQNIQARTRMVVSYLFAQLLPWVRSATSPSPLSASSNTGFLLVLGSSNVDEGLRGYMTKYDCSSADINPIGSISKVDLKKMLIFASKLYSSATLNEIATAAPSAELQPIAQGESEGEGGYSQTDEEDMGMSYKELSVYGFLRKVMLCGPVAMYVKLLDIWRHLSPAVVAAKVKSFFTYYSINRHKMTTLTPSYHAERYSPDDNRFDLRPFLYNVKWTRQFNCIDALVANAPIASK